MVTSLPVVLCPKRPLKYVPNRLVVPLLLLSRPRTARICIAHRHVKARFLCLICLTTQGTAAGNGRHKKHGSPGGPGFPIAVCPHAFRIRQAGMRIGAVKDRKYR